MTGSYCSATTTAPATGCAVTPAAAPPRVHRDLGRPARHRAAGATRGIIALQGKPLVPVPDGFEDSLHAADFPHDQMYVRVRPATTSTSWARCRGTPRRLVADTEKCLGCHVGSLYQHGNTRVDNVTMCIICHNPASSDQNNRVLMGVNASEAYDGKGGPDVEFKTMLTPSTRLAWKTSRSSSIGPRILCLAPEGVIPRLADRQSVVGLRRRPRRAAGHAAAQPVPPDLSAE